MLAQASAGGLPNAYRRLVHGPLFLGTEPHRCPGHHSLVTREGNTPESFNATVHTALLLGNSIHIDTPLARSMCSSTDPWGPMSSRKCPERTNQHSSNGPQSSPGNARAPSPLGPSALFYFEAIYTLILHCNSTPLRGTRTLHRPTKGLWRGRESWGPA